MLTKVTRLSVITGIAAFLLLFGTVTSSKAAQQSQGPRLPKGAVWLNLVPSKAAGSAKCILVNGRWTPGVTLNRGAFITYDAQVKNLKGARRKLTSRTRKQIATLKKKAAAETKKCRLSVPLRLNLKSAVGLAVSDKPVAAKAGRNAHAAQATTSGSNLAAILGDGELRSAVESGTVSVADVASGPSGETYLAFGNVKGIGGTPVNLADAVPSLIGTAASGPGRLCTIARIDSQGGQPTCVDDYGKNNHCGWTSRAGALGNRIVLQALKSGEVFYLGRECSTPMGVAGGEVLTRVSGNVETSLTQPGFFVRNFAADDTGSVFLSGHSGQYGSPTNPLTESFLKVDSSGTREEIAAIEAFFIERFPDGNIYYSLLAGKPGVWRFIPGSGADPIPWLGNVGYQSHNPLSVQLCNGPEREAAGGFCANYGGFVTSGFARTSSGRVFAAPGIRSGRSGYSEVFPPRLFQYYPDLQKATTSVDKVALVTSAGGKVAVTGLNAEGKNITTVFDPDSGSERVFAGPDVDIQVDSMFYSLKNDRLVIAGTRVGDGAPVVAQGDPDSGVIDVTPYANGQLHVAMAAVG